MMDIRCKQASALEALDQSDLNTLSTGTYTRYNTRARDAVPLQGPGACRACPSLQEKAQLANPPQACCLEAIASITGTMLSLRISQLLQTFRGQGRS